jgi:pimeloyl-ACP methyl ester carboxylesterase
MPLRLINGSADPNSGAHMMRAFLQHAPDSDLVSLSGIGHWPQLQATQRVQDESLAFLLKNRKQYPAFA